MISLPNAPLINFPLENKNNYNWKSIQINKGASGEKIIYSGININNNKDIILVKQIELDEKKLNEDDLKNILNEFYITLKLKTEDYFLKNVYGLLSLEEEYLYLVIKEDVIPLNYLITSKKYDYLSQKLLIKWIVYQITFSIYILHSNNIIHNDIKPTNILINNEGGVSLYGFNSAVFEGEECYEYTLTYSPPEILNGNIKADKKMDMWGLGIIILELYLKKYQIFKNENIQDKKEQLEFILSKYNIKGNNSIDEYKKILNNEDNNKNNYKIDNKILDEIKDKDKDAIDLINNLLSLNPKDRFTAEQVLNSEYLKDFKGTNSFDNKKIIENPFYYKEKSVNKLDKVKFIEFIKQII